MIQSRKDGAARVAYAAKKRTNRANRKDRLLAGPSEHQIQVAFVEWWEVWARSKGIDPRLGFAIPNGGARHPAVAVKLKAEGVKPGVPDFMVAVRRPGSAGLFIEFKTDIGRMSENQKDMARLLTRSGYLVKLCRSVDEGIAAVMGYFVPPAGNTVVDSPVNHP